MRARNRLYVSSRANSSIRKRIAKRRKKKGYKNHNTTRISLNRTKRNKHSNWNRDKSTNNLHNSSKMSLTKTKVNNKTMNISNRNSNKYNLRLKNRCKNSSNRNKFLRAKSNLKTTT